MKPLRIFRHVVCEPPSYLCHYLARQNIPYDVICLDEGMSVPENLDDVSGLVFMGGTGSVNDSKQWIIQELELIKQANKQKLPVLGICFGAQLISKALGGTVLECQTMEIGWHKVESVKFGIVSDDNKKTWLTNLPAQFEVFQWHAHTFSVPSGATALWRNSCCEQQGFAKGKILATQFHLEVTANSIMELTKRYASDLTHASECAQTVEQLTEHLTERVNRLHLTADKIYARWLTMAKLM